jgi:hypothetical protein
MMIDFEGSDPISSPLSLFETLNAMPLGKNEPWQAWLDREYPHHVALPAEEAEKLRKRILVACGALNTASRTRTVSRNDTKFVVYRFASETDAQGFIDLFGGERLDPSAASPVTSPRIGRRKNKRGRQPGRRDQ